MDTFKRGKVDLVDFTKLLKGLETEDWIANAKQQIGLTLSRKFTSMNQAFNTVSRDEKNLVFNNFQKWMNDNKVLTGFMLNESMLKELFAELDPHKKGYLSESDFTTAFGKFDWKSAMVIEFVDTLQAKFGSEKEAFQHLCSYNKSSQILNYNQFSKSVKEIFGNRFLEDDIKEIWSQIAGREDSLNAQSFAVLINNKGSKMGRAIDKHYPRDDWAYQDFDIIKGTVSRSMQHAYEDKDNIEHQCRKIVETVKDILRTSPKTL
jgi:Ca2+-binding EF-hand superfamily protein